MCSRSGRDVLVHGHRVEERGTLEDHPHLLPHLKRFLEAQVRDVVAIDADATVVRHEEPEDQLEDRGLSRSRFADDDNRLSLVRGE